MKQIEFNNHIANDLPSKKEEAWRFTSLADFKDNNWLLNTNDVTTLSHDELKKISLSLLTDYCNIVIVDGNLNKTLSDDLDNLNIVVNTSLDIGPDNSDDKPISKENVDFKLIQIAKKFSKNNIYFQIKDYQTLDKPVQFLFVQSGKVQSYESQNIKISVGKNAEAFVIIQSLSLSDQQKTASNLIVKVNCNQDSRVKVIQIQNENENSFHFSQTFIQAMAKSQIQHLNISMGGKLVRNYFEIEFQEHHAQAEIYGIVALGHEQHTDNYTVIHHQKGENQSVQTYKSILADSARSVFRGRVRIELDAQKANSEQLNNNLLLSSKAHADSIPQLEIYADDVKAAHGSTVGQLNADELFYFLSRGISRSKAIKMLAEGYAQELIFKLEQPAVANWLFKMLGKKLEGIITHV